MNADYKAIARTERAIRAELQTKYEAIDAIYKLYERSIFSAEQTLELIGEHLPTANAANAAPEAEPEPDTLAWSVEAGLIPEPDALRAACEDALAMLHDYSGIAHHLFTNSYGAKEIIAVARALRAALERE